MHVLLKYERIYYIYFPEITVKEDTESHCTDTQNGIANMIFITTSVYISFISKTV